MRVLIGVPCMENVKARFCKSILGLYKPEGTEVFFSIGNNCAESRDIISRYAIQNRFDYVFFVDSDETFETYTLSRLLKADKDIISGLIMHRVPPYQPVLFNCIDGNWETMETYPEEPFTVDCSGGGAGLLIKTYVLENILNVHGEIWSPMTHTTEDLSFALRAKDIGIKWWCDPSVKLGHIGEVTVTENFWKNRK